METKTQFQVFDTYDDKVNGTYKIGSLDGLYFRDLVAKLGDPSVVGSDDDKVQYEWIMKFEGEIFTIYDWKTYDAEYTEYELTTWSIGGNEDSATIVNKFKEFIYEL
jgi:hypothetical protein